MRLYLSQTQPSNESRYIVRRFQDDGKVTEITPQLEDGYPKGAKDEKAENGAHTHAESVQSVALETQTEDEAFEWREVIRGQFCTCRLVSKIDLFHRLSRRTSMVDWLGLFRPNYQSLLVFFIPVRRFERDYFFHSEFLTAQQSYRASDTRERKHKSAPVRTQPTLSLLLLRKCPSSTLRACCSSHRQVSA